jgi:hypothetical protein
VSALRRAVFSKSAGAFVLAGAARKAASAKAMPLAGGIEPPDPASPAKIAPSFQLDATKAGMRALPTSTDQSRCAGVEARDKADENANDGYPGAPMPFAPPTTAAAIQKSAIMSDPTDWTGLICGRIGTPLAKERSGDSADAWPDSSLRNCRSDSGSLRPSCRG